MVFTLGYRIRRGGLTNRTLQPNNAQTENGVSLIASTYDSENTGCFWGISKVKTMSDQVLLYDARTGKPATADFAAHVKPGQTLTPAQLGLKAVYVSLNTASQTLTWDSSATTQVNVHPISGNVTGVINKSIVTITIKRSDSTAAATSFTVYCSQYTMNVDFVYDGGYAARHTNAAERVSLEIEALRDKYFNEFGVYIYPTTPSKFQSLADKCTNGHNYSAGCECDVLCINSGWDGEILYTEVLHHKNVYNILYAVDEPTEHDAKVAFTWHDCCMMHRGEHLIGRTYNTYGLTSASQKVALITSHNRSISQEIELEGIEPIILVHEFGHIFDVNNNPEYELDHYGINYKDGRNNCIYGKNFNTQEFIDDYGLQICDICKGKISAAIEEYMSN